MTVVVLWFMAAEREVIEQGFAERSAMRQRHDCQSARLLADRVDPDRFLVLLEFPSRAAAQAYVTESSFVHGGKNLAAMSDRVIGYYDDLESWPRAAT